jgi:LCP family protein required for cell wall assembly
MRQRSSSGNLPSLQQAVLAALFGICIGLILGKLTDHQPPFDALKSGIRQSIGFKKPNSEVVSREVSTNRNLGAVETNPPQVQTAAKINANQWSLPNIALLQFNLPKLAWPNWSFPHLSFAKINLPQIKVAGLTLPKFRLPKFRLANFDLRRFSNLTNFDGINRVANQTPPSEPSNNQIGTGLVNLPSFVPTLDNRMNLLVMGVDSNGHNTDRFSNTRSDTMMLVSIDPAAKRVGVVSIPRDSRVAIDGHGEDKINAAHAYGGAELAVATVQQVFSVPIDRYVVVDVQGLKKLLEILGPVDVLVEKKMSYTDHTAGLHVALMPGQQQLDAGQSEQYIRFRHDATGDIGRIDRQQWFLRQVYKKLQDPSIILKLPELYTAANEYVQTNLSIDEMAKLAAFAKDLKPEQIKTAMVPGKPTMIRGGSYWLPDLESSRLVFNRLAGAPLQAPEPQFVNQDVAYAADIPDNVNLYSSKPISVDIRYARASEDSAKNLTTLATTAGYNVKNRMRIDLADCQHEEIIENTARSNEEVIAKLKQQIPCLSNWPSIIKLDPQSPCDISIVISPTSTIPAPPTPGLKNH